MVKISVDDLYNSITALKELSDDKALSVQQKMNVFIILQEVQPALKACDDKRQEIIDDIGWAPDQVANAKTPDEVKAAKDIHAEYSARMRDFGKQDLQLSLKRVAAREIKADKLSPGQMYALMWLVDYSDLTKGSAKK